MYNEYLSSRKPVFFLVWSCSRDGIGIGTALNSYNTLQFANSLAYFVDVTTFFAGSDQLAKVAVMQPTWLPANGFKCVAFTHFVIDLFGKHWIIDVVVFRWLNPRIFVITRFIIVNGVNQNNNFVLLFSDVSVHCSSTGVQHWSSCSIHWTLTHPQVYAPFHLSLYSIISFVCGKQPLYCLNLQINQHHDVCYDIQR